MSGEYFGRARMEALDHLPERVERVLELGCGTGATLAALRERLGNPPGLWLGGAEISEEAAAEAEKVTDRLWTGDVEGLTLDRDIEPGSLDVILCLDVLEHLVDPWTMVRRLTPLLRPGGRLIVSLPNIRHWKFISGLLFRGDFHYRDAGLLDRTHLRFFVKETALELLSVGGLTPTAAVPTRPFEAPDMRWFLLKLSANRLEQLLVKQYLFVAEAS